MAEPADPGSGTLRDLAEKLVPGGGTDAQTRIRDTVEGLVRRGKLAPEDVDEVVNELVAGSKSQTHRLADRASGALSGLADQLGLVRERQFDELELRVAQLEHRLRLLEQAADDRPDRQAPPPG